jgi:hypothetical protein
MATLEDIKYIKSGTLLDGEGGYTEDTLNRPLKDLVYLLKYGQADIYSRKLSFPVTDSLAFDTTVVDGDIVEYNTSTAKYVKTVNIDKVIGIANKTDSLIQVSGVFNFGTRYAFVKGSYYSLHKTSAGAIILSTNTNASVMSVGIAVSTNELFVNFQASLDMTNYALKVHTHAIADITQLQATIDLLNNKIDTNATDISNIRLDLLSITMPTDYVNLTTDQNVSGIKRFNSYPLYGTSTTPASPVAGNAFVTKWFVEENNKQFIRIDPGQSNEILSNNTFKNIPTIKWESGDAYPVGTLPNHVATTYQLETAVKNPIIVPTELGASVNLNLIVIPGSYAGIFATTISNAPPFSVSSVAVNTKFYLEVKKDLSNAIYQMFSLRSSSGLSKVWYRSAITNGADWGEWSEMTNSDSFSLYDINNVAKTGIDVSGALDKLMPRHYTYYNNISFMPVAPQVLNCGAFRFAISSGGVFAVSINDNIDFGSNASGAFYYGWAEVDLNPNSGNQNGYKIIDYSTTKLLASFQLTSPSSLSLNIRGHLFGHITGQDIALQFECSVFTKYQGGANIRFISAITTVVKPYEWNFGGNSVTEVAKLKAQTN